MRTTPQEVALQLPVQLGATVSEKEGAGRSEGDAGHEVARQPGDAGHEVAL